MIFQRYGPVICIGMVILVIFMIWMFYSDKEIKSIKKENENKAKKDFINPWSGIGTTKIEEVVTDEKCNVMEAREEPVDNTPVVPQPFIHKEEKEVKEEIGENEAKEKIKCKPISRGEKICCKTLESIYGVPFETVRPDFLKNPETGKNLEIDCYNADLKIGGEYNGIQHYVWPNYTNQSKADFISQIRRDQLKLELCKREGVYLITVPYNIAHKDIPKYIVDQLPETVKSKLKE